MNRCRGLVGDTLPGGEVSGGAALELVELLSALELPVEPPAAKTPGAPTKYLIDSLSDEVFFALSFDDVRRNDDARDEAIVSKIGS